MGRAPCCDKTNVKRGPWSPEEDATLRSYLERHGTGGNWIALPHKAGLRRCGKSCRLRWLNYLRPDIKHGCFTQQEDNIICTLYNTIGSRWSVIASHLPGRTDNDVKNYWNTKLKKKLLLDVQQHQSTTTQDQTATTTPKLQNPDPVLPAPALLLPRPVPKVVKTEAPYTPNYFFSAAAGTGTGMGMEFSSSYDELILSELIPPDPNSFPTIMQSMSFLAPQSTTADDDHLANTTANGQQQLLQEVAPPEDGYSSTTSSTSADHHNGSSAINHNACSGATGGQYGTDHDLFLQELGFGSYSHELLAGLGGFGELLVNAPLIYSSSSSTKPQAGVIYQNHVTNYYS